jgi:hypothetical protein
VKKSILGTLIVLMFVAVGVAAAPPLTFTFSDVHANKTATETDTFAVNNAGTIAGDYVDAKSVQHAMILAGKKLTTVDHPNCVTSGGFTSGAIAFYGINSAGAAAGWCTSTKTALYTGFVYAGGKFTAINFPKSNGTQAIGINDKGAVVGLYLDSGNVQHGFLKVGTKYTRIDVKGDTTTEAWGINNSGQITVFALSPTGTYESFIYNGKTFKKIVDPNQGTSGTIARIVNNKGDVAGAYFNTAGSEIGFLLHGGKYYDVNDPKGVGGTRPDGLNDKIEIVGRYLTSTSATVGFKAITKTAAGDNFVSTTDTGAQDSGERSLDRRQASNTP